jgi:hypothetical protein
MNVTEGWYIEGPDESVGIFGWTIYHDECPCFSAGDPLDEGQEPAIQQIFLGYLGWGVNRGREVLTMFTCRDCKQTLAFTESEWDPMEYEDLLW